VEEHELDPDPIRQVAAWLEEARAAGIALPEATTLATADAEGRPSARMVLLKGVDERGLSFFTNRESRKAEELARNPRAALVLYWQPLHRQVRVEGRVEPIDDEESLAYFRTRPRGSRLAAWASPQSRPLGDRAELEGRYRAVEERFGGVEELPLPPFWGGYRVVPDAVELWHGRENRLHDRVRYERSGGGWIRGRLAP
jgi:pyridoxamine 5'-phosphate oxidase